MNSLGRKLISKQQTILVARRYTPRSAVSNIWIIFFLASIHYGSAQATPSPPPPPLLPPDAPAADAIVLFPPTVNNGSLHFVISNPNVGPQFPGLSIDINNISINATVAQKVALVQAQVAVTDDGWTSTYIGGRLSFKYKGVNAPIIAPFFDSSGETNQFDPPPGNPPPGYAFDFGIGGTRASGVDGSGTSSFVQVATETGDAYVPIDVGDTPAFLIEKLTADLEDDGVDVAATSPTSFEIVDTTPNAYLDFQITDTNLDVAGAGMAPIPEPSTFPLLGFGLLSFLGYGRRRRAQECAARTGFIPSARARAGRAGDG